MNAGRGQAFGGSMWGKYTIGWLHEDYGSSAALTEVDDMCIKDPLGIIPQDCSIQNQSGSSSYPQYLKYEMFKLGEGLKFCALIYTVVIVINILKIYA